MKKVIFIIVMFSLLGLDTLPQPKFEKKVRLFNSTIRPTLEQQIQLKKNELIRVNSKIEISLAELKYSN